ncbi:hypothetical protein AUEXF2481DRAFT_77043 [Aureobasidium subglaciale EXF-2481]|uniref:ER membrane protein complex subunit 7 beta-sandwich domain-containing protein n=1 Tax=Aureobasidium subglaciale (strain EXF-2481) TaxID=1043005 RepID=A0A074YN36_AURSE|nr:uncharacterized protein AUEXF2481DRAFT_77043 [Aureobasidium subglaciale EXF-2481]KAI5207626.1 hypothetical protein E4T38_03260 [Aureobasidium subglaciale]KAI5226428.1 hypothetical protein E4T40_03034 [Aureobasidium subglaciale]KAI5229938.1 hypothetical protein E4T41_03257 [Aureobasidium subglaciale]KAI5264471.1 hypothetical protein E4T46_03035 [Aureobasidium subglaciale]KEQ99198.1 hypothetical protein AUEXF2481DRAFT_77043 [Aureobasidium subglaciale EXF-2481]
MKLLPSLALLSSTAAATSLHLSISPSSALLDPSDLPASTHATLYGPSGHHSRVPLRIDNTFLFPTLSTGEYLLDIYSRDHVFPSLRVDVVDAVSALPIAQPGDGEAAVVEKPDTVVVYLTHPGNKWSTLGAKIASSSAPLSSVEEIVRVSVSSQGKRGFYEQRQGFDLLSFFKNPMILMGVLSMGLVFGMPYLMENMDEETKAEFAEMQKQGPIAGIGGAQTQNTAQQIQNFDLAGWMAGKSDAKK